MPRGKGRRQLRTRLREKLGGLINQSLFQHDKQGLPDKVFSKGHARITGKRSRWLEPRKPTT